ncbi:MAG: flagella assembly protein FlgT middle domain-containing protein [Pseudomonadota bacterium]
MKRYIIALSIAHFAVFPAFGNVQEDSALSLEEKVARYTSFVCDNERYKKSILVTPFFIDLKGKTRFAELQSLGTRIGRRFQHQLSSETPSIVTEYVHKPLLSQKKFERKSPDTIDALSRYVASNFGNQLALLGIVNNVELDNSATNMGSQYKDKYHRSIAFTVYVLDIYTKQFLLDKRYYIESDEVDVLHKEVNFDRDVFWHTSFGKSVSQGISDAITDIYNTIRCTPSYTQIIDSRSEGYVINMGLSQGVSVGDIFVLHHKNDFTTLKQDVKNSTKRLSTSEFLVKAVNESTAVAVPTKELSASNNHLFQIVSPAHF